MNASRLSLPNDLPPTWHSGDISLTTARLVSLVSVATILLIVSGGCSDSKVPKLAAVKGVVTLDGTPYPNAHVAFSPPKGRPSEGVTDSEGKFELTYLPQVKGAELGSHTVMITTQYQAPENPTTEVSFVEPLPPKYNVRSSLSVTVENGNNEVNFPLTSK
jgi:hypothetical protein